MSVPEEEGGTMTRSEFLPHFADACTDHLSRAEDRRSESQDQLAWFLDYLEKFFLHSKRLSLCINL